MPKGDPTGRMRGFQLRANLPAALKLTGRRDQEVKAFDIPIVTDDDGTHMRVVCGRSCGKTGHGRLGCDESLDEAQDVSMQSNTLPNQ